MFEGVECVWYIVVLVGLYYKCELYDVVNCVGMLNVIVVCKKYGITKCVMSSLFLMWFDGNDINGK